MKKTRKRPLGVMIIGCILILTSLHQMFLIPKFAQYSIINHGLSETMIRFRFIVSWLLRIFGLISGVGVLTLQDHFRRILIGLSFFSIGTVFLRHTYSSFLLYTTPIYDQGGVKGLSLESFTWIAVAVRCFIEIGFSFSVIYYFTRPKIKEHFA